MSNLTPVPNWDDVPAWDKNTTANGETMNAPAQALLNNVSVIRAGAPIMFDSVFADKIDGYPVGARIVLDDMLTEVVNEQPNNTNDPNVNMTGWKFDDNTFESIADMLAIENPKDGMRVFVKSYHAGLKRSARFFTYDSSVSTINNGVTVFNGWVADNLTKLSVYDCGVKGGDDDNDYNDHDSLRKLAALICEDGNTDYEVDFESVSLVVGRIDTVAGRTLQYAEQPFDLDLRKFPDSKKTIALKANGAKIRWRKGMKFGTFYRNDGTPFSPTYPFYEGSASYEAIKNQVYVYFAAHHIRSIAVDLISITGTWDFDGGSKDFVIGGGYGDSGWQLGGYGIQIIYGSKYVLGGNIKSHDHLGDSYYCAVTNTETSYGIINNIKGYRSARQGFSLTGGSNIFMQDSLFYDNGIDSLPVSSLPKANIDIEAEAANISNVFIKNTRFLNAGNESVLVEAGTTKGIIFEDCVIKGAKSFWVNKPQTQFIRCDISGVCQKMYGSTTDEDRIVFDECNIDDSTILKDNRWVFEFNTANPIFNNCTFRFSKSRWFYNSGTSLKLTELNDCKIYCGYQSDAISGSMIWNNVKIFDVRSNPAQTMLLNLTAVYFNNVSVSCPVATNLGIYANPPSITQPNNQNVQRVYVGNPYVGEITAPIFEFKNKLGNGTNYPINSLLKVMYADNITALTQNTLLYNKGDTVHCTDPVARGGVQKWVCTTAGYYNATAWVDSTAYTVGSYINSSGKVYKCTVAGTSGTVAPSHSSGTSTDGTVTWEYVGVLAVFTAYS